MAFHRTYSRSASAPLFWHYSIKRVAFQSRKVFPCEQLLVTQQRTDLGPQGRAEDQQTDDEGDQCGQ